jgi:hypothetical protein
VQGRRRWCGPARVAQLWLVHCLGRQHAQATMV